MYVELWNFPALRHIFRSFLFHNVGKNTKDKTLKVYSSKNTNKEIIIKFLDFWDTRYTHDRAEWHSEC